MRQIFQCKALRSLCYAIILALVANVAPPLMRPASAQLIGQKSVGVVDFVNECGDQGDLLARLATDAVVVEMSKTSLYDVNVTRSDLQKEMDKLDLRPPLTRLGMVRLGGSDAISADAMVMGAIKSIQLSGSGATRKATVLLAVEMIDVTSGETVNGAVQSGSSSARVGFTADDDSLVTEAINNAAFLCVKTMEAYIIPEATVQMNLGSDQVMLNKGARDGMKPGMNMIVLRQKEIIGYIRVTSVDPTDCYAKVTKSMRGIQPEDKARAIFDMPTVTATLKQEPLPSQAPSGGGNGGSFSKIGKFLLAALVVGGFAAMFSGGRGSEPGLPPGLNGPMTITWTPKKLGHGQKVMELLIMRDDMPYKSLHLDPTAYDRGKTSLLTTVNGQPYYSSTPSQVFNVNYFRLDANPSTDPPEDATATVNQEEFGTPHSYTIRVTYQQTNVATGTDVTYWYTPLAGSIVATAIEPVMRSDVREELRYDPSVGVPEVVSGNLFPNPGNFFFVPFEWAHKEGADVYQLTLKPAPGSTGRTYVSPLIHWSGGPLVTLPEDMQRAIAQTLDLSSNDGKQMIWRVDCRRQADTNKASQKWVKGEDSRFTLIYGPPGPPL